MIGELSSICDWLCETIWFLVVINVDDDFGDDFVVTHPLRLS